MLRTLGSTAIPQRLVGAWVDVVFWCLPMRFGAGGALGCNVSCPCCTFHCHLPSLRDQWVELVCLPDAVRKSCCWRSLYFIIPPRNVHLLFPNVVVGAPPLQIYPLPLYFLSAPAIIYIRPPCKIFSVSLYFTFSLPIFYNRTPHKIYGFSPYFISPPPIFFMAPAPRERMKNMPQNRGF